MLLGIVIVCLLLSLALPVIFGPPYLPTLGPQVETALDLLDLEAGQTLLELGSGDGKVLLASAQRGLQVVGIEISPLLVIISWLRTWRYRRQVKIIWGNYFTARWPAADGIFTFMLGRQMAKLDRRIRAWQTRPVWVASFAFAIPGKKIVKKQKGVFLYNYKY